jgi:hypothetical protein
MTAQGQSSLNNASPKPAARSRLCRGDFGPSDSALAVASGWRLLAVQSLTATLRFSGPVLGRHPSALSALVGSPNIYNRNHTINLELFVGDGEPNLLIFWWLHLSYVPKP